MNQQIESQLTGAIVALEAMSDKYIIAPSKGKGHKRSYIISLPDDFPNREKIETALQQHFNECFKEHPLFQSTVIHIGQKAESQAISSWIEDQFKED